jgi:uncharacterized damage-inducible protein DinB
MRYQDQIVRATQRAAGDVIRSCDAVPHDKIEWAPGGDARSVLSQMQELAQSGSWFIPIIRDLKVPEFDAHAIEESKRLRANNDTLEKCIAATRESTSALCAVIESVPDSVLEQEITLPFGGGMTVTIADVLSMHWWNMTYHLGQINMIQLMLGDRQMH